MNRLAVGAKFFQFAPRLTPIAIALTASCLTACANLATGGGSSGNAVKIVSSLPMTGSALGQNQSIVNGIKQALAETNSTACDGKLKIDYDIYDDATAAAGKWEPAQVTSNANKAVSDASVVAVIGHFNSGAAKLSIPILNASNLVMVSPVWGKAKNRMFTIPMANVTIPALSQRMTFKGWWVRNGQNPSGQKKSISSTIKNCMEKG
jgi:ABC-type branched-subunit amino acid transport system substrate-binding protein